MIRIQISKMDVRTKVDAALSCVKIIEEKAAQDSIALSMAALIEKRANEVMDSMGPKQEKLQTEQLLGLDVKRDNIYRSIYHIINANDVFCPQEELKESIQDLRNDVCEDLLDFLTGSYKKESTILNVKLEILKSEKYKDTIAAIGLTNHVTILESTQKEFIELYEQRRVERDNRPKNINETEIPLNQAIVSLRFYIIANYDDKTHDAYFQPFA
jgi:Family of unknown function (DUF6261)